MQFRFFHIAAYGDDETVDSLNKFVRAHRVAAVDRHFIQDGANSGWAVCVSYLDGAGRAPSTKREKVDYRQVLSDEDFAVFAKLRDLRKRIAEREGVPAYALFTNEQLAAMVQQRVRSATALGDLPGVGDGRVEKYGEPFLSVLRAADEPLMRSNGGSHEA